MRARGFEQLLVAAESERDPVRDLEARLLAGVLDGVDDLAGEALAAQVVVQVERQRDGAACLRLDLVALERLHHELEVVRLERVLVAVDRDADLRARRSPPREPSPGSSPSTAAATCGIDLPKRGPSVR